MTYIIEIVILLILSLSGAGRSTGILFCITVADCFILYKLLYATVFGVVSFILFLLNFLINQPVTAKSVMFTIGREGPVFLLVGLIAYLYGRILKSNTLVEKSMKEIQIREAKLRDAYDEIKHAYETLEEMAAVKERNRIAREIHDTVGHTITTVIVEMEAGRMLAKSNPELAMKKFGMAQLQASKALDELRKSVRLLANENGQAGLKQVILNIIEEMELHTGITIKSFINIPDEVDKAIAELIVRILKEGLANGIRHGGGTAFFLELIENNGALSFILQDNGKGCDSIKTGFGLTNMTKAVQNLRGAIEFNSEPSEGFEIRITVPLNKGDADGID